MSGVAVDTAATLAIVAVVLLANVVIGVSVFWLKGHTAPVDRIAIGQLLGTLTVATLLVLAEIAADPSLRLVALALALLGAMTVGALVRARGRPS